MGEIVPSAQVPQLQYGFAALFAELAAQGVAPDQLLDRAGLSHDPAILREALLQHEARLALLQAAADLSPHPDTALRAGQRQKIADFGVYGFAIASSRTLGEALRFTRDHLDLAGAVLNITYEQRGMTGVFVVTPPIGFGTYLPFIVEFWRSSMTALLSQALGKPFPTKEMFFSYPAPAHADAYRRTFDCPVHFGCDVMEWHYDARARHAPCINTDALLNKVCLDFCTKLLDGSTGTSSFQRHLHSICLARQSHGLTAAGAAMHMGVSKRSLFRRLAAEGTSFQTILDEARASVALEYLHGTSLPIEEIANRCGFSDGANFRKAFQRWTGLSPSALRHRAG